MAKALLAVKSVVSEDDYLRVRSLLVHPDAGDRIDQAIHGLSKEDEFALMCRLMGTATHLVHLEQRPVVAGDYLVPDFLARFQPSCSVHGKTSSQSRGFRCLVEVKSTTNDKFKIGGKKLKRLRAFADQFGLPLLFAVRFLRFEDYALWVMVEDCNRARNSLTVTYNGLTTGVRHVIWDDYFFFLPNFLYFRAVYDTACEEEGGARHERYGRQREFHIVAEEGTPISGPTVEGNAARLTGSDAFILSAFFEGFGLVEQEVRQEGTVTVQTLRPAVQFCSVADMVYSFNRLPRDDKGRAILDPSRILTGSDSDSWLVTREFIDRVAGDLFRGGVLLKMGLGEPQAHLEKWCEYGGLADLPSSSPPTHPM